MKTPRRLCVITPSFYPAVVYGGPIFTSLHTAYGLAESGTEVRVSTTNANMVGKLDVSPEIWYYFADNLLVKYYNESKINMWSSSFVFGMWRDIKDSDMVHMQGVFSYPTPVALLYSKLINKPTLLTPHGSMGAWCLSSGSRLKSLWLWLFIRPFLKKIIWHATADMEKMEILTVFPDARVVVIPNGINISEFSKTKTIPRVIFSERYIGKPIKWTKIIISMGRIHKKKGFDILIQSFAEILKLYPDAGLFIAGEDEGEGAVLHELVSSLGLGGRIFFVGHLENEDKVTFLANADVFALPSHNENFGMVYAESLASGTPIVASTNTPWERVEEYGCGRWVPNSVEHTTTALHDMLKRDREALRGLSKKFARSYDWKEIIHEFNVVIDSIDEHVGKPQA